MSDERAIQPDRSRSISLAGQPSRLLSRGLQLLDQQHRRLLGIGTLGGSWSRARAINNLGQIVGNSETADGRTRAFLWDHGKMHDLGSLSGFWSHATGINNQGQIVGSSSTAGGIRSFLWAAGQMYDLGLPETLNLAITVTWMDGSSQYRERPDTTMVHASDINDRGEVVGTISASYRGYVDLNLGFLWESSKVSILGVLPQAINDSGRIIGEPVRELNEPGIRTVMVHGADSDESRHRFTEGGHTPGVRAINDRGQIAVCRYSDQEVDKRGTVVARQVTSRSFLFDAGQFIDLGLPDSMLSFTLATGINNREQVVGWSGSLTVEDSNQGQEYTFVWGDKSPEGPVPFLWDQGRMVLLDSLVSDEHRFKRPLVGSDLYYDWEFPVLINESAQIAGTLRTQSGDQHAFLCE